MYNPGVSYDGAHYIYDSLARSGQQFNNFLAGFLMPNTPTGDVPNPSAPNMAAFNAGGGPVADPNAMMKRPGPSILDRFSAGAQSSAEGFDRFKQDAQESNALSKLLTTMYPNRKAQIDTLSLGEKRGMLQADQVQKAQDTARSTALARLLQAMAAQQQAQTEADKLNAPGPALVEGRTSYGVPYALFGKEAHFSDELAPNNPKYMEKPRATRDPGAGPLVSKDGKFYWDDAVQTWKPMAAAKTSGMDSLFGAPAAGVPKDDPLGLFSK